MTKESEEEEGGKNEGNGGGSCRAYESKDHFELGHVDRYDELGSSERAEGREREGTHGGEKDKRRFRDEPSEGDLVHWRVLPVLDRLLRLFRLEKMMQRRSTGMQLEWIREEDEDNDRELTNGDEGRVGVLLDHV